MTHVTCRPTAKNRHQLWNPTLGNRVSATFIFLLQELWALFDWVHYGQLLGTAKTFATEYETPIMTVSHHCRLTNYELLR